MNVVIFSGRLTSDPDVRTVKNTKVASFTIASNRKFKKQDGTLQEETTFMPVEAWDSAADLMERILKKADTVTVRGSLRNDQWEKDGQKHSRTKIRVEEFEKFWLPKDSVEETKTEEPVAAGVGSGEDIPF